MESKVRKMFWEELISYFLWYHKGSMENNASCVYIHCRGNVFNKPLASNYRGILIEPFSI
jgi:hypothetical protein